MLRRLTTTALVVVLAATTAAVAPTAQAAGAAGAAAPAKRCAEPAGSWQRATPAEARMDTGKLDAAIQNATAGGAFAVRVYRHGCLVAKNDNPAAEHTPTQSFSAAKSVVSLAFGRAQQLGLISPDDPVGALYPEADREHGKRTLRHLLTMTSGNTQYLVRDFNILSTNRVADGLTTVMKHEPGEYWNYWQTSTALAAESVTRAAGEDFQKFVQRELFGPIGIPRSRGFWARDLTGHTAGFWGLNLKADDYARLGELLRRRGVWAGKRLLSPRYVTEAVRGVDAHDCYGFQIWVSATKACNDGNMLGLPADMFQYNGLLGQIVTVFPSQGVVVVRTGVDAGWLGAGEREFYDLVLGSITDTPVQLPHPKPDPAIKHRIEGSGPIEREPIALVEGIVPPPLPPAGPWRARATVIGPDRVDADPHGRLTLTLACPPRWPSGTGAPPACAGAAKLQHATAAAGYDIPAGTQQRVRFRLTAAALRALEQHGSVRLTAAATNRDGTPAGTRSTALITVG